MPIATTRPPSGPAPGPEVDHPVGGLDHVEVVLDEQHRVAGVHQVAEDTQQLVDVVQVQPGGRLVEDVELAAAAPRAERQLARDLDALRLAAGERGRGLAQAQIAEPHLLQVPERLAQAVLLQEEADRLVHGQLQHVADVFASLDHRPRPR